MKTIDPETRLKRNEDILSSDLDGEKVMMSIERGEYYGLGKTGSFIWECLKKEQSLNELVEHITNTYDVSRNQCLTDVMPFLNDLLKRKLIRITE